MNQRIPSLIRIILLVILPASAVAQDNQEPPHACFNLEGEREIPLPLTGDAMAGGRISREIIFQEEWSGKQVFIRVPGFEVPYILRINSFSFGSDPGSGTVSEYNVTPFLDSGSNLVELELDQSGRNAVPVSCPLCEKGSLVIREAMHVRDLVISTYRGSGEAETLVRFHLFIKSYLHEKNRGRELEVRVALPEGELVFMEEKNLDFPLSYGQETELVIDRMLENPRLWSPSDPGLYSLEVTISDQTGESETLRTRFGIRSAVRTDSLMIINGDSVRLTAADAEVTGSLFRSTETEISSLIEGGTFNTIETDLPLPHRLVELFDRHGIILLRKRERMIPRADRPHINAPAVIWPGKN